MKIVIAHLYYDLLNLYGESGNVRVLIDSLNKQNIEVELYKVSLTDTFDFAKYDFVYIGSGTVGNQLLALKHLINYRDEIKQYIESDKFLLATGNAFELFGKYKSINNTDIPCLNLFDYHSTQANNRKVSEAVYQFNDIMIVGFLNHDSITQNIDQYCFDVIKGFDAKEGFRYKDFWGTYLIGPLLVRNPEILEDFTIRLVQQKNPDFQFNSFNWEFAYEAKKEYLKNKHNIEFQKKD